MKYIFLVFKYSHPFHILSSFRSVPQITIIHTGIGILRNGMEPKLIIVCKVFFRPLIIYQCHYNKLFVEIFT